MKRKNFTAITPDEIEELVHPEATADRLLLEERQADHAASLGQSDASGKWFDDSDQQQAIAEVMGDE